MTIEILVCVVVIFPILLIIGRFKFASRRKNTAPLAAGAWPIFGHLPLLIASRSQPPHVTLGAMADRYGPLFTVKLGLRPDLVLSNCKVAKECFTTHDLAVSARPNVEAVKHLVYSDSLFVSAPHRSYWREVRKLCHLYLLSRRQVEISTHVRVTEVKTSINELYNFWRENKCCSGGNQVLVELTKWFENLSLNIFLRTIAGWRYSSSTAKGRYDKGGGERLHQAMGVMFDHIFRMFSMSHAIPFLGRLDLSGVKKDIKLTEDYNPLEWYQLKTRTLKILKSTYYLSCKFYSWTHSPSTSEWYQLKTRTLNINVSVCG